MIHANGLRKAGKRVLVLAGDGFCGWPTALHLSARGSKVGTVDSFLRRQRDHQLSIATLTPIRPLAGWRERAGIEIPLFCGDVTDYEFIAGAMRAFAPDAVIHFAEQRSAPFWMIDRRRTFLTQTNNVLGTLNVLFAIKEFAPDCHLVKLGTVGECGTPNIDIEEGFIEIEHNGRKDLLPFPKQPGSAFRRSPAIDPGGVPQVPRQRGPVHDSAARGLAQTIERCGGASATASACRPARGLTSPVRKPSQIDGVYV